MFRDPREGAGVVSGYGEPVADRWLDAASQGNGAPVPAQIAAQMRGKRYSSFRAFRRAFWRAVSQDMDLAKSFNQASLNEMGKKRAPFVKMADTSGKRLKVELHHNTALENGGELYDMDNLRLLTPKNHIEVHRSH